MLDGADSSKVIDRAIAGAFVTVKPARRTLGSTTLKVENRLPFTITQPGGEGRYVVGIAPGPVRGRRGRARAIGAPADPGGDRLAGRTSRDQRPLIAIGAGNLAVGCVVALTRVTPCLYSDVATSIGAARQFETIGADFLL